MKLNRGVFRKGKTETAQLSGFKKCNSFPFNKKAQKKRSVFSGFQASEPAAAVATEVQ
jgi:hypothetical protein